MPEAPPKHIRHELHWLLDRIPESDVSTAHRFLRSLVDPVALSVLNAPYDDEPETEEERAAVDVARREPGPGRRTKTCGVSLGCDPLFLDGSGQIGTQEN